MILIQQVIDWLADHGCRDQYPRRDADDPETLFYVFVKDGHRRLGVPSHRGRVKRSHFEKLKQVVNQDEQDDNTQD